MTTPLTLAELLQDHFDTVFATVERGSWGRWVLDRGLAAHGQIVLVHRDSGYAVSLEHETDWVTVVSGQEWASVSDIGELIYAMRDLEYARWLGILPEPEKPAIAAAE